MNHILFVKIDEDDEQNNKLTLALLKYINNNLQHIRQMNIKLKVIKILSIQLKNKDLIKTLNSKGITRIPALLTKNNVYIGCLKIKELYSNNIKRFYDSTKKKKKDEFDSEDLDSYYRKGMQIKEHEKDDDGIGENSVTDMMRNYNRAVQGRGKSGKPIKEKPDNISDDDERVEEPSVKQEEPNDEISDLVLKTSNEEKDLENDPISDKMLSGWYESNMSDSQ